MSPRAVVLALAFVASGCATTGLERAAAIRAEAERARQAGALRCAPRELALAEANVSLAEADLSDGRSGLAEEHLRLGELGARRALELSRGCGPAAVPPAPPAAAVIEKPAPDVKGKDSDRDGVPDEIDRCPREPGPSENFGCPVKVAAQPRTAGTEEDRDHDGVPDRLDKCPDQVGPAPDGCPRKYTMVEVKRERIVIRQQVRFATGKAKVLPDSSALLEQVAQVLQDFPRMRVSIEGHTDSVGGAAANLKLSQQRAEAVRAWLIGKGIAAARLQAAGFGPTRPMASNGTARGREQNRRTEFRILSLE